MTSIDARRLETSRGRLWGMALRGTVGFAPWVAALVLVACGASNSQLAQSAPRVPIAHIAELPEEARPKALASLPVVLEIRKGDRFPIHATLDSRLLALDAEGTWSLEAKENFYVLLREDGPPVVSEDGVDFDTKTRNSFAVGFKATKGEPAKVEIVIGFRGAEQRPKEE